MELSYANYLADEGLREELERRARRERAETVHRHLARMGSALFEPRRSFAHDTACRAPAEMGPA